MNIWWEIFCRTGNLDAYIESLDTGKEDTDGAYKDEGDCDTVCRDGGLQ